MLFCPPSRAEGKLAPRDIVTLARDPLSNAGFRARHLSQQSLFGSRQRSLGVFQSFAAWTIFGDGCEGQRELIRCRARLVRRCSLQNRGGMHRLAQQFYLKVPFHQFDRNSLFQDSNSVGRAISWEMRETFV
jgi:hypothetical protein